jgi:putative Mg2+ transporter-C (MgtC) family protein
MGAALTTIIALGIYKSMGIPAAGDPGRIPAQVISALGFLGTGMIWVTEDEKVRGITDAASVWLTAILGMLIGAGMNDISVIGTTFFVLIYWITPLISARIRK